MVDLIDLQHFHLMENVNEEGKERDGALVFPGYSLHKISFWDYRIYNKIIVIVLYLMHTSMTRIKSPPLNQVSYVQLSIVVLSKSIRSAQKSSFFCDQMLNSDSSATIYRLASFEIYVRGEI